MPSPDEYAPQGPWIILPDGEIVSLYDSRGNLQVAKQDQFTEIIDLAVSRQLDTLTLDVATVIDAKVVRVTTTGAVPALGDIICLKDVDGSAFYQGQATLVTLVSGNQYDIRVDLPLDFAFSILDGCSLRSDDIAVDGSVTPVKFVLSPSGLSDEVQWDLIRFSGVINGTGTMDDGLFGDIVALTEGIVFRTENGVTKNIFNAKTNGDLSLHCGGDRTYATRAPAGLTSVSYRRTTNGDDKNGVTMRLTAAGNDLFVLIIQDDLTGIVSGRVNAQGHIVDITPTA